MFKPGFSIFNNAFSYWLGLFYGHIPESYPIGHTKIHHKYSNGDGDVTSTMYYDRSLRTNWLKYLSSFMLYWTGVSVFMHFYQKG